MNKQVSRWFDMWCDNMLYDAASLAESLASILFARYMAGAVDCEMDITAQVQRIVYDVKYYHEDISEDTFLDVLRRNVERLKACFIVSMETQDILAMLEEVRDVYRGM